MPFNKTGPLSQDELFELWRSVVDEVGYASPLIVQPDSGIELIKQSHAQFAATSLAVDQTFQSLYILPWSGQTNEPASGARRATVQLQLTRTNQSVLAANLPLVFQTGLAYAHAPFDYSESGSVQVLTGRRYLAQGYSVMGPGSLGPITVDALSEGYAAGYNLPLPNTITVLEQPSTTLSNDGASVVVSSPANGRLVLRGQPEVLTPDQIGQYVLFIAGVNTGAVARMIAYEPAQSGNGGVAILAAEGTLLLSGVTGTFVVGEGVTFSAGGTGSMLWTNGQYMLVAWLAAPIASGTVTGTVSSATATIVSRLASSTLTPESGTAEWRVLDWVADLGVLVTNPASPTGGLTGTLDAIGDERQIIRAFDEPDDIYRERVATPADVVSPNAIIRAINRTLVPRGLHGCFREVGRELFRGFYYDGDPTSTNPAYAFAYDLDFVARPQDRYKLLLDYTEFRAFFVISVPPIPDGEFGFAFDAYPSGFYDAAPYDDFYDGYPVGQLNLYRSLYNAVASVIAGGVGFDIVLDGGPCS